MSQTPPPTSPPRLAPRPFAFAVVALYLVSFASQVLLSPPVTRWAGVWLFALLQAGLIWAWIVLHRRRLRDAGRPGGLAVGIACIYALEIVLFVLMVWLILSAGFNRPDEPASGGSILHFFVILSLMSLLGGDSGLVELQIWIVGMMVLLVLPVVVAFGFSIWAATRPSLSNPR
jgi:hypothetical protein